MNKPGHFWCEGCGTDRPYDDAVNEIINGEALCYRCNHQLEAELAQGSPEQPLTARGAESSQVAVNATARERLSTDDEQAYRKRQVNRVDFNEEER